MAADEDSLVSGVDWFTKKQDNEKIAERSRSRPIMVFLFFLAVVLVVTSVIFLVKYRAEEKKYPDYDEAGVDDEEPTTESPTMAPTMAPTIAATVAPTGAPPTTNPTAEPPGGGVPTQQTPARPTDPPTTGPTTTHRPKSDNERLIEALQAVYPFTSKYCGLRDYKQTKARPIEDAAPGQFPWAVTLGHLEYSTRSQTAKFVVKGVGSLIAARYVLTSAHVCRLLFELARLGPTDRVLAVAGKITFSEMNDVAIRNSSKFVRQIERCSKYERRYGLHSNNIAVARLDTGFNVPLGIDVLKGNKTSKFILVNTVCLPPAGLDHYTPNITNYLAGLATNKQGDGPDRLLSKKYSPVYIRRVCPETDDYDHTGLMRLCRTRDDDDDLPNWVPAHCAYDHGGPLVTNQMEPVKGFTSRKYFQFALATSMDERNRKPNLDCQATQQANFTLVAHHQDTIKGDIQEMEVNV